MRKRFDLGEYIEPVFWQSMGKEMGNQFKGNLSWKIRDNILCFKGNKKIPVENLTKFYVKGFVGGDVNNFDLVPYWLAKSDMLGYRQVNLLTYIAQAVPEFITISHTVMGYDAESTCLDVTVESAGLGKVRYPDYDAMCELRNHYKRMLVQVPELHSEGSTGFAADVVTSVIRYGWWATAEILLKAINDSEHVSSAWCTCGNVLIRSAESLGNFCGNISYKLRGRGEDVVISNSERLCLLVGAYWIGSLYQWLGLIPAARAECDTLLNEYKYKIFRSLGNDSLADVFLGNEPKERYVTVSGHKVPIEAKSNYCVFKEVYDVTYNTPYLDDVPNMTMYNVDSLDSRVRFIHEFHMLYKSSCDLTKEKECLESSLDISNRRIKSLEGELQNVKSLLSEADTKYACKVKELQFIIDSKSDHIRRLQEELEVFKNDMSVFYTEDTSDYENEVPRSIEECVSIINEYPILCIGGELQFMEKLRAYGVTSVTQQMGTTGGIGDYQFFCVFTRFVQHKAVNFVKSHYNTNDVLFYFNGTNVESFIRAADDFIRKFFE